MKSAADELARARQTFDDVLIALAIDYTAAQMIRAAASSWAKAAAQMIRPKSSDLEQQ